MAQVKITEYFNSCKRQYYGQPQKRRKTVDGCVHLNYDSVENGKCKVSNTDTTKEINVKSRKLIPSQSAPNNKPSPSFSDKKTASNRIKKKSTNTDSNKKVGLNFKLHNVVLQGSGDIRQAFESVKPKSRIVGCDDTVDVNTRNELSSEDADDELKGAVGYVTPKKNHSTALNAECSPPKRRKQNDDFLNKNKTNNTVERSESQGQVSARRSLLMTEDSLLIEMTKLKKNEKNSLAMHKNVEKKTNVNIFSTEQGTKEKKILTPNQVKEQLQKCGKLEEVKQLLTSLKKRTEKLKNKVSLSPQKVILAGKSKSPEKFHSIAVVTKECQAAPAYERYHSLAAKGAPSLTLPFKYKQLADIFRCVDTVVSILHNRQEMCTFSKLKFSVQSMLRRAFKMCNLGQIKTVFPLAYFFHQEKCHPTLSTRNNKAESYQLTITPNFNYSAAAEIDNISAPSSTERKKLHVMNPSCLVERRNIFHGNLISIVKKHHQAFLETLNRPVTISNDEIHRWHPRFALDDVPEIEPTPLPKPPGTTYSTAQDVLDKMQGSLGQEVENALKNVAEKKANLPEEDAGSSIQTNNTVRTGVLKGISESLLQKIRAKEESQIAKEMMRKPEDDKKLEMISRLPELIRILRSYLVTEKKSTISVEHAKMKLSESYHSPMSPEEIEEHLNLLSDILPDWLSLITIRKGIFLKIDKEKEISSLLERLENERKKFM